MQGARAESPTRPFLEPPLSHSGSRPLRIDCRNAYCPSQPQFATCHRWRLQQRRTAIPAKTAPATHHHSHRNHRRCCCPCRRRQRQHQQQPQISTPPIATLVAASAQGLYVKPSSAPFTIDDQFSRPLPPGRFLSTTHLDLPVKQSRLPRRQPRAFLTISACAVVSTAAHLSPFPRLPTIPCHTHRQRTRPP